MSALNILICDDDPIIRKQMAAYLAGYGAIEEASDGAQAVARVEQALAAGTPYALICLDIKMPNLDGQQALERIREMERRAEPAGVTPARILMCTSISDVQSTLHALDQSCEAYIVKPFRKRDLAVHLDRWGWVKSS
jgi:two-component system chemotaxis response regulator CheY